MLPLKGTAPHLEPNQKESDSYHLTKSHSSVGFQQRDSISSYDATDSISHSEPSTKESRSYLEAHLEKIDQAHQRAEKNGNLEMLFELALRVMVVLSKLDSNKIQHLIDQQKEVQNDKMKEIQTTTFNGRLAKVLNVGAILVQAVGAAYGIGLLGSNPTSQAVTAVTTFGSAISSGAGLEKDYREQGRTVLQFYKDEAQRLMQNHQQRKEGVSGSQRTAEQNLQQLLESIHRAANAALQSQ